MPNSRDSAPFQIRPLPGALLLFLGSLLVLAAPVASGGTSPSGDTAFRAVLDPDLAPLRRGAAMPAEDVQAPFPATLDGEALRLRLTAFPIVPGGEVELAVEGTSGATLAFQDGGVRAEQPGHWRWRAPEVPGAYALRLSTALGVLDLTAFVVHPAERVKGGELAGYAIGEYRSVPLRGDPAYLPPDGFVEVTARDRDLLVTPRLVLGQFLCKQPGDPRFVAVSMPLLVKLEAVMDRMEAAGYAPESLVIMSGFRTPAYNRAIGNTTVYSRHLWGDAADIYLDGDGDGDMDDLDRDGRVDVRDARVLAGMVEQVAGEPGIRAGGLAVYRRNASHGPFVHVDTRGTRARW